MDGSLLRNANGVAVDGDGDSNPGGTLSADFQRRFGDFDGNGVVDFLDFAQFRLRLGS